MVVHLHTVPDDAFGHVLWLTSFLVDFFHHGQLHPDGGSWIDWLGESALVDAIVQQHGTFAWLHEQASSLAQNVIAMGHLAFEHGAFEAGLVDMCIEVIS